MVEEFMKVEQKNSGIEQLLQQLLDEIAGQRSAMMKIEEALKGMKEVAGESLKRIEDLEKREGEHPTQQPQIQYSFPPPSPSHPAGGKSPPTLERRMDPPQPAHGLRIETRNRGNVEGILGIP
ncbi:hypothetical protein PR202_ga30204 [Eleusine coracana subsp. coracana]|uniref:Uncharacterized protein n=1 Tax=Eleusine coracana subsp. coracana TaxID=191504 RepID=A0AAV5DMU8_ELECO|nr:hypothetical protein PR202_ga30204 [Eleusine coracana subsp. coracana]